VKLKDKYDLNLYKFKIQFTYNCMFIRTRKSELIDFIEDTHKNKPVMIFAGARQVGKTTLIEETLKNRPHLFLNLEKNPSHAESIDRCADFTEFSAWLKESHRFEPTRQALVIDEAQQSLKLGSFVRFMKEEWEGTTVILTGSAINELHLETPRRPVGRETHLTLWPMTFKEFLMAAGQESLERTISKFHPGDSLTDSQHERLMDWMDKYLAVGGLPEVIQYFLAGKDYNKLRRDIFKSYEDDFIRYFAIENVNLFKRCFEAVAANVGSPSKDSQAVRLDGPGYKKIAGIFARLEKWKLIIKCEQLGTSPESNKYHPKRYIYDIGVLADLRLKGMQTLSLKDLSHPVLRTPLGGLIENHIALSLTNQFEDFFGIRLSTQAEIDFAVKVNGTIYPIECKIASKFKLNHMTSLVTYLSKHTTKGHGFFFYGGPPQPMTKNSYILPYYLVDEMKRWLIG